MSIINHICVKSWVKVKKLLWVKSWVDFGVLDGLLFGLKWIISSGLKVELKVGLKIGLPLWVKTWVGLKSEFGLIIGDGLKDGYIGTSNMGYYLSYF